MENQDLIIPSLSVSDSGDLYFGSAKIADLVQEYGTPLYLLDENRIRAKCKAYVTALQAEFGNNCTVYYASKACSFKGIYQIIQSEGVGADVVSCGEIATAKKAGFNLANAVFHSNNKTDADIEYAIDNGIGCFCADNEEELIAIDRIAKQKSIVQPVMLRLTPGIDPHTYEAVSTGKVDSKFGSPIETGQAQHVVELALKMRNIDLIGFHCHVGSQVFDSDVYQQAIDIMVDFIAKMKNDYGFDTRTLDIGGGFGVRYVAQDPVMDIGANIALIASKIKSTFAKYGLVVPKICMEPGRSIVADAGITVYTVGTRKNIIGYKNYVSVDGGMTDNPRFALYGSRYTVFPCNNFFAPRDMVCSVVGRCCESGDILQENVALPSNISRGDLICVVSTGAYNYSMSSNYNRIPRPPIVIVNDGKSKIAVRRETFDDLTALDV